jgi:hypothetical protein
MRVFLQFGDGMGRGFLSAFAGLEGCAFQVLLHTHYGSSSAGREER